MLEVAQRYVGDKQLFGQPLKFVRNLIESVMSTTIFSKRDICDIFNLVINTQNCAVALYHLGCRCDVDKINMLCVVRYLSLQIQIDGAEENKSHESECPQGRPKGLKGFNNPAGKNIRESRPRN